MSALQQAHHKAVAELIPIQQFIVKVFKNARMSEGQSGIDRAFTRLSEYRAKAQQVRSLSLLLREEDEQPYVEAREVLQSNNNGMLFRNPLADVRDRTLYGDAGRFHELQRSKPTVLDPLIAVAATLAGRSFREELSLWKSFTADDDMLHRIAEVLSKVSETTHLIAVDLETSGLTPVDGEVLEVGIVSGSADASRCARVSLLLGADYDNTGAEYIHGIHSGMISGLPKISSKSVKNFLQGFLNTGHVMLSHNTASEWNWLAVDLPGFLEANMDAAGVRRGVDTAVLSQAIMEGSGNRLEDFATVAGVEYENGHEALSDALIAVTAFRRAVRELSRQSAPQRLQGGIAGEFVGIDEDWLLPSPYPQKFKHFQHQCRAYR